MKYTNYVLLSEQKVVAAYNGNARVRRACSEQDMIVASSKIIVSLNHVY